MLQKVKLTIAYDGSAYVGWQIQPNGMSIQQRLEQALHSLTGIVHLTHSSGRTDAGVHARGMVCHFETHNNLPLTAWREGLNRFLPDDIAVRQAEMVGDDFHARFSAGGKHYRYTLLCDPLPSPLERTFSWRIKAPVDLEMMRVAAAAFVGVHDFSAFRSSGCAARTTEREIYSVDIVDTGFLIHVDVRGGGFLRHMVRMMVGTLVEIGRGKRPVDVIEKMLQRQPGPPAVTAPAHGLCLMEVWYG